MLATWHWLLDDGSLQDGEPHLAGTARRPRLHLSAATAAALGASEGDAVTVSTDRGSLTLPLVVADLPDGVVWVPTRTADAAVRARRGPPGATWSASSEGSVSAPRGGSPGPPSPTAPAADHVVRHEPFWLTIGKALFVFVFCSS